MKQIKPDEYPWIVPFVNVRDPAKALAFYESALGFERANVNEQDGKIVHAELKYRDQVVLMVVPEGAHDPEEKTPATAGTTCPPDRRATLPPSPSAPAPAST